MADNVRTRRLGLKKLDLADSPFGYNERLELSQALEDIMDRLDLGAPGATTGSVELFVSPSGSDSNPGSRTEPFLTIQAAVDSLPRNVRHPVSVVVDTGSFVAPYICGFDIFPATASVGAWLVVGGSMKTYQPATGAASGTVVAASVGSVFNVGWGTLTASADQGWTDDDLRGRWVSIVAGTGAPQKRVVASNFSSSLMICGNWSVVPAGDSQFALEDTATTITAQNVNSVGVDSGSLLARGIYVDQIMTGGPTISINNAGSTAARSQAPLIIQRFNFGPSLGSRPVTKGGPVSFMTVRQCRHNENQAMVQTYGGALQITDNVISGSGTSVAVLRMFGGDSAGPNTVVSMRNFFFTSAGSQAVFGLGGGKIESFGDHYVGPWTDGLISVFEGETTAVKVLGARVYGLEAFLKTNGNSYHCHPGHVFVVNNSRFDNCTQVFKLRGPGYLTMLNGNVTGSGNGTFLSLDKGARAQIPATVFADGGATTELVIDGNVGTLAAMRAASPKLTGTLVYGTLAFE